ncbi:MAG: ATP phosphoribosyltransferase regulatory subunit [Nitrospirae bacterium]|nr:ATP phosphoribosyltransferase regulatory subunit [Nitrospirota bacterium]
MAVKSVLTAISFLSGGQASMKNSLDRSLSMIPQGVATLLPEATVVRRKIEKKGMNVLKKHGFQEVITPLFEYLDILSQGMGDELIEKGYKFIDRSNGRFMLLRPDVTPQIARMVSMHFQDAVKPLKLCYFANIFRHEEAHAGREREIFQIGGEIIGGEEASDDADLLIVVMEILKSLKLHQFKIVLGHAGFVRSILNRCPPEIQKEIQSAIARKEISNLESLIKRKKVPAGIANQLMQISRLFGQQEVFAAARKVARDKDSLRSLEHLEKIYGILRRKKMSGNVLIDLAEVRDFEYYTGMVFEIFLEGEGSELGGGGRYDDLIGRFGYDCPSRGFALDVEKLQTAMNHD